MNGLHANDALEEGLHEGVEKDGAGLLKADAGGVRHEVMLIQQRGNGEGKGRAVLLTCQPPIHVILVVVGFEFGLGG